MSTAYKAPNCNGRPCPRCGKCRDWYYTGDQATLGWLQNWKNWSRADWERYRDNDVSDRFSKRPGGNCSHFLCILDGDFPGCIHFHNLGANAYYHAHFDLCLCNDNVRY